jgi:hypothetical protein
MAEKTDVEFLRDEAAKREQERRDEEARRLAQLALQAATAKQ